MSAEGASFKGGVPSVPFPGFLSHSDRILASSIFLNETLPKPFSRFKHVKLFWSKKYICYEKLDRFLQNVGNRCVGSVPCNLKQMRLLSYILESWE